MLVTAGQSTDCDHTAASILAKAQVATQRRNKAHNAGNVEEEISALRELIDDDVEMSNHCSNSGKYNLYGSASERTELAMKLAGEKQFGEAEDMFRKADAAYRSSNIAGNDTYSDNDLPFAYVLRHDGKTEEATRICGYWKDKVANIGKKAVAVAKNSDPQIAPYDTPQHELGRWELFCANEDSGIATLMAQIKQDPKMLAPVSTLGQYFTLNGDFKKAQELETKWYSNLSSH
jgi:hypothetical protein